ncbi:MAG: asparagine synthase B [Proteobacteria bacterium]|nr:asparagine synthase B [Pseudomonadota bacterium]
MCSILGILDIKTDVAELRKKALLMSKVQRHRGPDWTGIYSDTNAILAHERLAIVDPESGAQPLTSQDENIILAVNGEIYNHKELALGLKNPYPFKTKSDCEVIIALYLEEGINFVDKLQGMFAFILYDKTKKNYFIARDHLGIIPLYTGHDANGNFLVSSELKAIEPHCKSVDLFPPGHQMDSVNGLKKYYTRPWMRYEHVESSQNSLGDLKPALMASVKDHLMTDVPYGVLLSGGLDSSLIASIAKKFAERRVEDNDQSAAWWPQLHTFSVGLKGAPDLAAAKKVASFIRSVHHELNFTIQEGLDALSDVIFHIETFDVTSIRASTPMFLMARKIKAMGIKMVLSGEGADEVFGGYLYFHKAPNAKELHNETVRKLDRLHLFDCLRANKAMAAWGVEARVPFLDKRFLDVAMSINPQEKLCVNGRIEKHILRDAFKGFIPDEILWRQKEQFSDGVGYSWIDSLKKHAESVVSDGEFSKADKIFPVNTPMSKEAFMYRQMFENHFKLPSAINTVPGGPTIACSSPEAFLWDASFKINDPSGRSVLSVHKG